MTDRPRAPLRILAVSATWQGANDYAFVRAFRRMGHSVRVVPEDDSLPQWQARPMRALRRLLMGRIAADYNARLLYEARSLRPDLLFVFKGALVQAETLRAIRALGAVAIQFYPDTGFASHSPYLVDAIRAYDWVFSTKPDHPERLAREFGVSNASFTPHGFDPETHLPPSVSGRDREDYGCDISFIGNFSSKKQCSVEQIVQSVPQAKIRIWGPAAWARSAVAANRYCGHPVWGLEYAKAVNLSRINLGLLFEGNADGAAPDRITSRSFHIPASGGFLLHERTDAFLAHFEEGREAACFSTPAEMIDKIRYYLGHEDERAAIAAAGRARCLASGYSIEDRAKSVIAKYRELRDAGNMPTRSGGPRHDPLR